MRHIIQASSLEERLINPFKVKLHVLWNHTSWSISGDPSPCLFIEPNVSLTAELAWPDLQLSVWHQIYSAEACAQYTVNAMNAVYFTSIKSSPARSINTTIGSECTRVAQFSLIFDTVVHNEVRCWEQIRNLFSHPFLNNSCSFTSIWEKVMTNFLSLGSVYSPPCLRALDAVAKEPHHINSGCLAISKEWAASGESTRLYCRHMQK